MTTTTSSSKKSRLAILVRHDLGRVKYMTLLYTLLCFLFLPLQYILQVYQNLPLAATPGFRWENYFWGGNSSAYANASFLFFVITLLFVAVIGLQLLQYNFNKRAVDVYYALPFTRRQMMLSYLIAGSIALAGPVLLSYAIIGVVNAAFVHMNIYLGLLSDALLWSALLLFLFYSLCFVANFVGNGIDALLFTLGINCTPFLFTFTVLGTASIFLAGYTPSDRMQALIPRLHPLSVTLLAMFDDEPLGIALLLWALIAAALFAGAVFCFTRRDAELAESAGRDNWLKLIEKLVGIYLGANLFALLFLSILGTPTPLYATPQDVRIYLVSAVFGALLSFVILEVVLGRGFKTIRRNLWIGGAGTALTLALLIPVSTGLMGYEQKLPAAEEVASVRIGLGGYYSETLVGDLERRQNGFLLEDPENIAAVLDTHAQILSEIDVLRADPDAAANGAYMGFDIDYTLRDGSSLRRSYRHLTTPAADTLQQLFDSEEMLRQTHPILLLDSEQVESMQLHYTDGSPAASYDRGTVTDLLLQAVQEDTFGTAGQTDAFDGQPLYFLDVSYHRQLNDGSGYEDYTRTFQLPILPAHTQTIGALEQYAPALAPVRLTADDVEEVWLGYTRDYRWQFNSLGGYLYTHLFSANSWNADFPLSFTPEEVSELLALSESRVPANPTERGVILFFTLPVQESEVELPDEDFLKDSVYLHDNRAFTRFIPVEKVPAWLLERMDEEALKRGWDHMTSDKMLYGRDSSAEDTAVVYAEENTVTPLPEMSAE